MLAGVLVGVVLLRACELVSGPHTYHSGKGAICHPARLLWV
jgi:hypothetical protein